MQYAFYPIYGYNQKEIFEYEDNNSKNRPNLLSNDLYN